MISGFVWHTKNHAYSISAQSYDFLSLPEKTWYPWFCTVSYEVIFNPHIEWKQHIPCVFFGGKNDLIKNNLRKMRFRVLTITMELRNLNTSFKNFSWPNLVFLHKTDFKFFSSFSSIFSSNMSQNWPILEAKRHHLSICQTLQNFGLMLAQITIYSHWSKLSMGSIKLFKQHNNILKVPWQCKGCIFLQEPQL